MIEFNLDLYIIFRITIFVMLLIIMIEDIKTKMVSSIFLYAINAVQIISVFFMYSSEYFYIKILIAICIFIIYFSTSFMRKYVGEADVIFLCLQIVSKDLHSFIVFWWAYLIFSLIYGIIIYIRQSDAYVPMFPSFAFGEIVSIILGR